MGAQESEAAAKQVRHFLWTSFEDGAVIFDQRTGDTHALDLGHASALQGVLSDALASGTVTAGRMNDSALEQLRSLGLL